MAINLKLQTAQREDNKRQNIYGLSLSELNNQYEIIETLKENIGIVKDAIIKSGGWATKAAELLSCTTLQLTSAISQTPELLETFLEVREKYLDFAEIKLLGLVRAGDLEAIKFWLKCQGKKRGWIERPPNEQEIPNQAFTINIEPAFNFSENNETDEVINKAESKTIVDLQQEYKDINAAPELKSDLRRNKLENAFAKRDFEDETLWQK